jgi:hypothetical protein
MSRRGSEAISVRHCRHFQTEPITQTSAATYPTSDLAIVRVSFGKKTGQSGFDPRADINNDGIVDIRDLAFVARKLPAGTKCP